VSVIAAQVVIDRSSGVLINAKQLVGGRLEEPTAQAVHRGSQIFDGSIGITSGWCGVGGGTRSVMTGLR
jgi:hypothetical protein